MRWTDRNWFKNLCLAVVCIFFSTSISPMAIGFAPPAPRPGQFVRSLASLVSNPQMIKLSPSFSGIPSKSLIESLAGTQVSKLLEATQEKMKELEMLPRLQNLGQRQEEGATSCAVPVGAPLVFEKDRPFTLSSSSKNNLDESPASLGSQASIDTPNPHSPLHTIRAEKTNKKQSTKQIDESAGSWLGRLGDRLGGLLVSEAFAQEPPAGPLDSTPDANTMDQFIIDKAQELGNDPVAIFNFVRDEIAYESYRGSLRGARGTLWSYGGNALDQASLLIALLRVSGIPAQYAQGTITDPLIWGRCLTCYFFA